MHDIRNAWQQEALGILGVNLIHACYFNNEDPVALLNELNDRLSRDRIEIDMLRLSGPDFEHVDNRLMALMLSKMVLQMPQCLILMEMYYNLLSHYIKRIFYY